MADRRPLRAVSVIVSGIETNARHEVLTDAAGRFSFLSLPPGTYELEASKAGYVSRRFPNRIALRESQLLSNLMLGLARGAVLSGRIVDVDGEALGRLVVAAVSVRQNELARDQFTLVSTATTDDRGVFRLHGLPASVYVVASMPVRAGGRGRSSTLAWTGIQDLYQDVLTQGANSGEMFAVTFYPGTAVQGMAEKLVLAEGEERLGLDFTLGRRAAGRVEGSIDTTQGQVTNATVTVFSEADGVASSLLLPVG
jgi:hypothetical protein